MEFLYRDTEAVRIAADLIQREQTVVDIQGRIFEAFRHDRSGHLLEFADKTALLCLSSSLADAWYLSSSMSCTKPNSARLTAGLRRCA